VANQPSDGGEATRSRTGRNRANSIQKRVHALLNENKEPPPKTAEGYGRYTAEASPINAEPAQMTGSRGTKDQSYRSLQTHRTREDNTGYRPSSSATEQLSKEPRADIRPTSSASAPSKIIRKPMGPAAPPPAMRPNPPPKPTKLRTGGSTAVSPTKLQPAVSEPELNGGAVGDAAEDDWEKKFAKKYPSLSGLEMVETVIGRDP